MTLQELEQAHELNKKNLSIASCAYKKSKTALDKFYREAFLAQQAEAEKAKQPKK